MVSLKIVLNFSRFKPALNRNRFLGDLRSDLNSLNSDTGYLGIQRKKLHISQNECSGSDIIKKRTSSEQHEVCLRFSQKLQYTIFLTKIRGTQVQVQVQVRTKKGVGKVMKQKSGKYNKTDSKYDPQKNIKKDKKLNKENCFKRRLKK